MMSTRLTQEQLLKLFMYEKESGRLFRKGTIRTTGTKLSNGYIKISINYEQYYAHQLIWTIVTGKPWPDEIDHENRVKDDNRFENLRETTKSQNSMNSGIRCDNSSGARGVSFWHIRGVWRARVKKEGREYISYHKSKEEAIKARDYMARQLYGEFIP